MLDPQEKFEKYLSLTYRYLGIRNRSEKEIRDYLNKKNALAEVSEKIVALMYEQKFLDDEAFARSWIMHRARFRPKGKRMLEMELKQKGIDKDTIEKVMEEENEELPDELTQAKNLIGRRIEKLQGEPKHVIYQKIGSFLGRRGYGWEIIKKAIDDYLENRV